MRTITKDIVTIGLIHNLANLAPTAHYNATELAKLCKLSVRQLQRVFRRHFERAPQDWLNEQRIKAAEQLLLSGRPVKTVAFELGRVFKIENV